MGKVSAGATMSLDGFIAGPDDTGFDLLFKWYGAGDVEVPRRNPSPLPRRQVGAYGQPARGAGASATST
jgi:hypothetical protein